MKRLTLLFIVLLLVTAWRGCVSTTGMYVELQRPPGFELEGHIPAGDSLVDRPVIIKKKKHFLAEYPSRIPVKHRAIEERWSVDSPSIATVKRGGVFHGHRPGWATFTLKLRQFEKQFYIRVGYPMDSLVMRFPVREAMVGDTVELFYRRYYADGSEESAHQWRVDPDDRDRSGIPVGQHLYVPVNDAALAGDTIRFWLRRPGSIQVKGITHGREVTAQLRVRRATDRSPRLIRAQWGGPQPERKDRRPFRCYELEYGPWSDPRMRLDQKSFAYLPTAVELDSVGIFAARPDLGLRINPMPGGRIETPRFWHMVGVDSVSLHFETADGVSPHNRVVVRLPLARDTVSARAEEGTSGADVTARRIACAPRS
jgi:hypothetical protein